ncbi:MAG TPA: hypothetical protein GXX36_04285 [Clostridiaceae bacterium]|nr:hypothetical protein [Clostridiaceae bacterium]
MMLLSQNIINNSYDGVTEKIKQDLILKLKEKGIHVSDILIDMDSDNINMKVCISSLLNQWNFRQSTD